MNEQEREILIKEARLAAVHDVEMALAKLIDERGQREQELTRVAEVIMYYLGQRMIEVNQDKGDRQKLSHTSWGG